MPYVNTRKGTPSGKSNYTTRRTLSQERKAHKMKIGQILVEIEEIGLEVDEVVSLLSVFEKWFDASFK